MTDELNRSFWQTLFSPKLLLVNICLPVSYTLITVIVRDVHRGHIESIWLYALHLPFVLFYCWFCVRRNRMSNNRNQDRFHLSTAMAIMFTAGIILWLNLQNRTGWPFDVFTTEIQVWKGGKKGIESVDWVSQTAITLDIFVGYLFLNIIGYLCERRIRNQEARRISGSSNAHVAVNELTDTKVI